MPRRDDTFPATGCRKLILTLANGVSYDAVFDFQPGACYDPLLLPDHSVAIANQLSSARIEGATLTPILTS